MDLPLSQIIQIGHCNSRSTAGTGNVSNLLVYRIETLATEPTLPRLTKTRHYMTSLIFHWKSREMRTMTFFSCLWYAQDVCQFSGKPVVRLFSETEVINSEITNLNSTIPCRWGAQQLHFSVEFCIWVYATAKIVLFKGGRNIKIYRLIESLF